MEEEEEIVNVGSPSIEYEDPGEEENSVFIGSMDLAGVVQQCIDLHFATLEKNQKNNSPCLDNPVLDFSKSVVQVRLLLEKWEDLMIISTRKTYFCRVQALHHSLAVLQFVLKAREQVVCEIRKRNVLGMDHNLIRNENKRAEIGIHFCFMDSRRLKLLTRLMCLTLYQTWRDFQGRELELLLHVLLDIIETFVHGATQNVHLNVNIIREWMFILAIPWSSKLGNNVVSCQYVAGLNFVRQNKIIFDSSLKERCLNCFRFEIFHAFKDTVRLILQDTMLTEPPNETCVGVLQLISGFWWPVELFSWKQLLNYCVFVCSTNEWMHNERIAAALAEAIVRLPCIYADISCKGRSRKQPIGPYVPRSKGCRLCDKPRLGYRTIDGKSRSVLKTSKLKVEDEIQLRRILLTMLQSSKTPVNLRLINMLKSIRTHSEVNLLSFTNIFLKMFKSTNSVVQIKSVDLFGHSSRQTRRVVKKIKRALKLKAVAFSELTKLKTKQSCELPRKVLPRNAGKGVAFKKKASENNIADVSSPLQKRKTSSNSKNSAPKLKKAKLESNTIQQNKSVMSTTENEFDCDNKNQERSVERRAKCEAKPKTHKNNGKVKSKRSKACLDSLNIDFAEDENESLLEARTEDRMMTAIVSQKDIFTRSKSAFPDQPPLGRFDAGSMLYNNFLYRFYMSCGNSKRDIHRDWDALLFNHMILQNLARYVDSEAWMVEVFRCYLHMLARLEWRHVVLFSQRTFTLMAERAGCQPWELFSRFRETVSDEMRKLCLDLFFLHNPPVNDKKAKELCQKFFLRVRVSLDMTPKLMMTIFLRLIVKQCIITMFQDDRAHTIIAAISEFVGSKSLGEFLQIEFAYYYPHALIHTSEAAVDALLQCLKNMYGFDPVVISKMSVQMLHIEMISNIFEHRESVMKNYMTLVELEEVNRRKSSSTKHLTRAIGASLDKRYIGVFLNFEAKFLSKAESIVSKRKYLGCFALLMSLLGKKRVSSSKIKLYSMLNSLRILGPRNHDLLFHAWRVFINNLEDISLCQMVNQLFAGMSYLRSTLPSDVDGLFMDVLQKSDSEISNHVKQLHFLHDICTEAELAKTMGEVMLELQSPTPLAFYYQLIDELGHENTHVRYRAAKRMHIILKQDITSLLDLKFENQIFSPSSTKLLQNLFSASKGATEEMREICASCIGLIGALDPRRFNLKEQLSENARFGLTIFTVGETDFLIFFIEELTRVLQGSVNTRNFDSCAYCIQEVIKLYEIEISAENSIWRRLSPKAQDLLNPLFTSKYSKTEDVVHPELPCPIYLSEYGRDFKKWIYHWTVRMVSVIKTDTIQKFFNTVLTIVERSDQMGLVLIPYVASYALMEGTCEDAKMFLQEVDAVLAHWVPQEVTFVNSEQLEPSLEGAGVVESKLKESVLNKMSWLKLSRNESEPNDEGNHHGATQAVFKILDHLTRLVRNPKLPPKRKEPIEFLCSQQSQSEGSLETRNHSIEAAKPIANMQKKLYYDVLAKAAFECHNFARSLMYMEQHLLDNPRDFDRSLGTLQRIYVALYDEDSVKGIEIKRKGACTLMEDVLTKLSQGKFEQCIPLFETMVGQNPDDLVNSQQLTSAYLALNQFDVGSLLVKGCIAQRPEWSRSFDEAELEISIKQNSYEKLDRQIKRLSCEKLSSWGVKTAKAFLEFNQTNLQSSKISVAKAKVDLITNICSGAAIFDMGFYFRHYKDLIRLQLLSELEEIIEFVQVKNTTYPQARCAKFNDIQSNWNRRLRCAHKSVGILQPVISFRKLLLEMTKAYYHEDEMIVNELSTGIRNCYVQLAKLETGLENFGRANQLFIESKLHSSVSVFYEEGKMLYKASKYNQSLQVLEAGMTEFEHQIKAFRYVPASKILPDSNDRYCQFRMAKAALLYAKQKDEQRKVDLKINISNYKLAIDVNKRSEKNYFYMACYYDRLWSQADDRDQQSDVQMFMVQNYSYSLEYGCNYIYQSLPRLLTVWFDYAAQIQGLSGAPKSSSSPPDDRVILTLTHYIQKLLERAPTYIFIIAFSQLISRLAHANATVYNQLKEVLAHMIVVHPDQVLWMMMSVLKSTYPKRVLRCQEILKLVEHKKPALKSIIRNYKALADKLITFTMRKSEQSRFIKVSEVLPQLPKLIRNKEFSNVLMPFQEFMRPVLPRGGKFSDSHNPFPKTLVYIDNILEPVQVMASLQKPKRITFVGTNGRKYAMMCKPSDDLRKDAKMMEINNMVHWYMRKEKESRQRNLIVRTYNVTPLSDICGILEWVPNLHGYRPLITSLYKEGLGPTNKNLQRFFCDRKDSIEKKRKMFVEVFQANHPIVMSYWFLKSFHSPQSWYMARTSYVKTAAVMSIIGFLMGLGDRHGENISLDSSNGDVVHVDFNCLFNKGETFDWPERVPFRLTRNMINGMGPLGYEGMYRSCCEIVMRIIRNHSSVFLTIIRPFVFDPLLEWETHIIPAVKNNQVGECNNPKAVDHLNNVRDRLIGSARNMTKEKNIAYSVEAHVNYLIKESVSLENLCQMYIGWAGYL